MAQNELFSILDTVDSTNNYATGQAHAGLAKHGNAWFAIEQTAGKGQRGKTWQSSRGENIIMSVIVKPCNAFRISPFIFSALIAGICRDFVAEISGTEIKIKWPNDIYYRDRKAGGILIENIFSGAEWRWAVIGIGLNINQDNFDETSGNAVSLKTITGRIHDPIILAQKLHEMILARTEADDPVAPVKILTAYNAHLYKRGREVKLKKDNAVFTSRIIDVDLFGQLRTRDVLERSFESGEIQWII